MVLRNCPFLYPGFDYFSRTIVIFNEFRREKLFFTRETFLNYLRRIQESTPILNFNENTIAKDFNVFVNMYKDDTQSSDIEDSFSGILSEIGLLKTIGKGKDEQYQIENNDRDKLPDAVVLYAILDNPNYGNSISLNVLEYDNNSPGTIFCIKPVWFDEQNCRNS